MLVKHNSCLRWHLIESQIKEAVGKVPFGKDVYIHLDFGTGEKPKETDAGNLEREFEPALILVAQDFMLGVRDLFDTMALQMLHQ